MAHGYPDYGVNIYALSQFDQDNAELAARLGSPYNILRSGKVIFIDDFEDGITKWVQAASGGATITDSTVKPYSGAHSIQLLPTAVLHDNVVINKFIPLLRQGVYAADCLAHFETDGVNPSDDLLIGLEVFFGVNYYTGQVRIYPNSGNIEILANIGGANTWKLIHTGTNKLFQDATDNMYNYIHLAVDTETKYYKSLLVNDRVYDLTQYLLGIGLSTNTPTINIFYMAISNGAALPIQIDNFIFTMDEQ